MDPVWQYVSAVVFYEAVFYFAIHINSIKLHGYSSRPNAAPLLLHNYAESHWLWFRNYQRAELLRWESRWGKEASLIEFYVAVVGDLNMPEFITRRIIMSYKIWQSQIGPHTSSLPHHHWGGPVTAILHFKCIRSLPLSFSENETFVFDIGGKKKSIWI